jgi:hypothetical protein
MAALRFVDPEAAGIEESFGWSRWVDRHAVSIGWEGVSVPEPIAIGMAEPELAQWAALPRFDDEEAQAMISPKIVCYDEGWIGA